MGWDSYERLYDAELSQNYLSEFKSKFPQSSAKKEILRKINLLKEILVDSTEIATFDSTSVDSALTDTIAKKMVSLPKTRLQPILQEEDPLKIPDVIPIITLDTLDAPQKQLQSDEKQKIEEDAENVPEKMEQNFVIHEVQQGDWLSKLAIQYQNATSTEEMISFSESIQKDNSDLIQDIDIIQPGWKIKILSNPKEVKTYE